ncbi:hypothetical protein AVEN_1914-1 [Araneus ventricosus]|uniref:Uncharacterized protein n=1 Tax=Araneus ventricosus TaxID=182803 RepID=A0A4Y2KT33_ARAVE|nr:hypothetical protein AVEN_1914-1 [Araneus ventricosus]
MHSDRYLARHHLVYRWLQGSTGPGHFTNFVGSLVFDTLSHYLVGPVVSLSYLKTADEESIYVNRTSAGVQTLKYCSVLQIVKVSLDVNSEH